MKRLTLSCLIISVLYFNVFAQSVTEISIDEAIRLAMEKNIPYSISRQEVNLAKFKVMQNSAFLPEISLQGTRYLDEKLMTFEMPAMFPGMEPIKGELDFTKNYEFTFQVTQPVFTGGKIWFNFRNAKLDLSIAREKERNSREDTILNVKRIFYTLQILTELKQVQKEALDLAEANHANIKQRYELGMASQYDLLRSEMAVSAVKPELTRAENFCLTTASTLKMMIGISEKAEIVPKGELTDRALDIDQLDLIEDALKKRSEVLQLDMELAKMGNLLKMSWAQFIPDIMLVARYSYRSDLFQLGSHKWEDYYTIALGINFTIFSGLKREGQIGQAKVAKRILELSRKQLSDATVLDVQSHIRTIRQEYENILLGKKNLETAKEGVRIADISYKEGLISLLELNASNSELTRAQVGYLQALFQYNIAIAELEKITREQLHGGVQ